LICRRIVPAGARPCPPIPPLNLHGKEGVDGSSPSEGSAKTPHVGTFPIVLCGRKAQAGWDRAQLTVDLPVLRVPHPSGRWLNAHPEDRDKIVAALVEARRFAYQDE
jgi:hypothetical protein